MITLSSAPESTYHVYDDRYALSYTQNNVEGKHVVVCYSGELLNIVRID